MKIGVIDVGSNSVRLMVRAGGKTLYKAVRTTRLSEKLSLTGVLQDFAMERTANAVLELASLAQRDEVKKLFVFATAAVRSAKNGAEFVTLVMRKTSLAVDVIPGVEEAQIGLLGAVGKRAGAIIDVGGASTEISVRSDTEQIYSKSLDVGTVRLFDWCGMDEDKLSAKISEMLPAYGILPKTNRVYAIGGTATTLAAVDLALPFFDEKRVDGHSISYERLKELCRLILPLSVEERRKIPGMDLNKLDVIGGGMLLLLRIMEYWNQEKLTVSCADNLEGYAILKGLDECII